MTLARAAAAWLLAGVVLAPNGASARPAIALLAFGGDGGDAARTALSGPLGKRYEIVHGQKLLDACDQLGISMTRGANLARAAAEVGVVAVVGGSVKGGQLVLAIYSGKTGQPIGTGVVPLAGPLAGASLGKALTLTMKALRKAPKSVGKKRPAAAGGAVEVIDPGPSPGPSPAPAPSPPAAKGGGGGGEGAGSLKFEPDAVEKSGGSGGGGGGADGSDGEDSPGLGKKSAAAGMDFSGGAGGSGASATPPPTVSKPAERARQPRIEGALGLGTWIRSFMMNDYPEDAKGVPKYGGAAFTIRLSLTARPAGFFTDNFLSNIFLRLNFKQSLGLQSKSEQTEGGQKVPKVFGTSLREIVIDFGYNWRLLSRALSPYLDIGMGYGMMDFAIDWEPGASQDMPSAAYRFVLFGLGFRLPFKSWIGAHLGADYRIVLGTGEIEDGQKWYGSSSTGGINLLLGANATFKGFIATAEYAYTRYFFAFANETANPSGKLAGGALDQLHTLMVSIGYGF